MALKLRENVTRNLKQWPKNGHECVSANIFKVSELYCTLGNKALRQQVRIHLCQGGPRRDFADTGQQSRGGGKNLGLKIGGGVGGGPGPPALPLRTLTRRTKDIGSSGQKDEKVKLRKTEPRCKSSHFKLY